MNGHRSVRLAIVSPWFGPTLNGGAEQQAWQIATRLAARGHDVQVLTTCAQSFHDDWAGNYHRPGTEEQMGVKIRRFPVARRNRNRFDALNTKLLALSHAQLVAGLSPLPDEEADVWRIDNINAPGLERYLRRCRHHHDVFLFIPYLYGPTMNGLPTVSGRAWLQPCLHDEAYAYLPAIRRVFFAADRLLFNSEGERQLAARLYGPMVFARGIVIGEGIEPPLVSEGAQLPKSLIDRPYLLCLGRRAAEKGTDRLAVAFRAFKLSRPDSALTLVLAGPGEVSHSDIEHGIIDLGWVDQAQKTALLGRCVALCQPSRNESFSRVMFEAWTFSRPVLVDARCTATANAVIESGGGWTASSTEEWRAGIARFDAPDPRLLNDVGASGKAYAERLGDWDCIIDRYEDLLVPPRPVCHTVAAETIHQLLPNLSDGDAISSYALQVRDWLRARGVRSDIFAREVDPKMAQEAVGLDSRRPPPGVMLLYHHSIGSIVAELAAKHPGPKCLIYHNVTPHEFMTRHRPDLARLLRLGREQLWTLAACFDVAAGVSDYNARELDAKGFRDPMVMPLIVDPRRWNLSPDDVTIRRLHDGRHNLLFVGRFAPHKCQHELVEMFAHYRVQTPNSRLVLAGASDPDPYSRLVQSTIQKRHLEEHVLVTGPISDAALQACYRTASAFVSLSEHEGFGVPLIEAMWFDVPVIAFKSSAVEETLDGAGIMVEDKDDLPALARLVFGVVTDDNGIRGAVLRTQRERRSRNGTEQVSLQLDRMIRRARAGVWK